MSFLQITQIVVSLIIVVLILLQNRGEETSGIFGGAGGGGGFYYQKRGLEKLVFALTIIFVIIFAGLGLLNLVLPSIQNLL